MSKLIALSAFFRMVKSPLRLWHLECVFHSRYAQFRVSSRKNTRTSLASFLECLDSARVGSDRLGRGARSWGGHEERLPRAQPLSPDTTASLACLEAFTGDTHTKVERRKTTERRGQGRHHACDGHESARTSRQGHRTRGKMATTMEMNLMTATQVGDAHDRD